MKKYCAIAMTLVLTAALLTGCRNRRQPMETITPSTAPATQATTVPTTEATRPTTEATETRETIDQGNGPLEGTNGTAATDGSVGNGSTDATVEGRSARPAPKS